MATSFWNTESLREHLSGWNILPALQGLMMLGYIGNAQLDLKAGEDSIDVTSKS